MDYKNRGGKGGFPMSNSMPPEFGFGAAGNPNDGGEVALDANPFEIDRDVIPSMPSSMRSMASAGGSDILDALESGNQMSAEIKYQQAQDAKEKRRKARRMEHDRVKKEEKMRRSLASLSMSGSELGAEADIDDIGSEGDESLLDATLNRISKVGSAAGTMNRKSANVKNGNIGKNKSRSERVNEIRDQLVVNPTAGSLAKVQAISRSKSGKSLKGRGRSSTNLSNNSRYSRNGIDNRSIASLSKASVSDADKIRAKAKIQKTLSRESLSHIDDGSIVDEMDTTQADGTRRRTIASRNKRAETEITIPASQVAAYINAVQEMNADPNAMAKIDVEIVETKASDVDKVKSFRTFQPKGSKAGSRKSRSGRSLVGGRNDFHDLEGGLADDEDDDSPRKIRKGKQGKKKSGAVNPCLLCLCSLVIFLALVVILAFVFQDNIIAAFNKDGSNSTSP